MQKVWAARLLAFSAVISLLAPIASTRARASSPLSFAGSDAAEYAYYAYVPSNTSSLDIVGIQDPTRVVVYDLATGKELVEFTVGRMELRSFTPANDTYLKVVSDGAVAPSLSASGAFSSFGGNVFYPATTGGFVGRDFVFMAFYTFFRHNIFTLEDADVTVYDATGHEVQRLALKAHTTEPLGLNARAVYHITSTGNVLISTWTGNAFTYLPSLTGSFVGRMFYAYPGGAGLTMVFANEDVKVKAIDPTAPGLQTQLFPTLSKELKAGESFYQSVSERLIFIESTGDISVLTGDMQGGGNPENLGDDISILGARPDQELRFYAPTKALLFAPRDLRAEVDGLLSVIPKDALRELGQGYHVVKADGPVIIEVLGRDEGFDDWGAYLVSSQDLEATYPAPQPPQTDQTAYLSVAAVTTLVIALLAVLTFVMKRRRRKQ